MWRNRWFILTAMVSLAYVASIIALASRIGTKAGIAAALGFLWIAAYGSYWLFAVVATCYRFRYVTYLEAWQRYVNGLCVHCGYDLRATQHRCPECGEVPAWPRA